MVIFFWVFYISTVKISILNISTVYKFSNHFYHGKNCFFIISTGQHFLRLFPHNSTFYFFFSLISTIVKIFFQQFYHVQLYNIFQDFFHTILPFPDFFLSFLPSGKFSFDISTMVQKRQPRRRRGARIVSVTGAPVTASLVLLPRLRDGRAELSAGAAASS